MSAAEEYTSVIDDRSGFYMVPSASIAKARARLSGAHLSEALAGLVCLARASFAQHGASREEHQCCEANLDELAGRILGVSRARALRILDNLVDAGALHKEAHRFDGTRRLPTRITFADLAFSFAYVSGPAFRRLAAAGDRQGAPPLGPLALYVTLVALGGEQRDEFPEANRRMARASQPELARLSGLSVSSVKRAVGELKAAGLLNERPQPPNALKTKAVYRLIDPSDERADVAATVRSEHDRPTGQDTTVVGSQPDRSPLHAATDEGPEPNRPSALSATDDGLLPDRLSVRSATDGPLGDLSRVRAGDVQIAETQKQTCSPMAVQAAGEGEGGEVADQVDRLVEVFFAWTTEALGERRAQSVFDRCAWQAAGRALLADYDLQRILAGVDRLARDPLLADHATTLPAFVKIADRAIARAAADRGLARHRQSAAPPGVTEHASWASAREVLVQAVSAFGRAGEQRALAFLRERDAALERFARHVGWRSLSRSDGEMTDVKFAYLEFCRSDRPEAA